MSEQSPETTFALISQQLTYIKEKVDDIDENVKCNYVSKHEFSPVRNIVYGLVGLILTGVIIGLLALVIIK